MHTKDINNVTEVAKTAVLPHKEDQIAPFRKPIRSSPADLSAGVPTCDSSKTGGH